MGKGMQPGRQEELLVHVLRQASLDGSRASQSSVVWNAIADVLAASVQPWPQASPLLPQAERWPLTWVGRVLEPDQPTGLVPQLRRRGKTCRHVLRKKLSNFSSGAGAGGGFVRVAATLHSSRPCRHNYASQSQLIRSASRCGWKNPFLPPVIDWKPISMWAGGACDRRKLLTSEISLLLTAWRMGRMMAIAPGIPPSVP
ncbi:hypothetical protein IF2G_08048 [Cordyceps javanica]|nr:hypothetical protein IF2G_08048 [Cordyceps javanica]